MIRHPPPRRPCRRSLALAVVLARRRRRRRRRRRDQVTFILVNDIYLMGDQAMPDGKRRGGFARLAAVVKAERAKGEAAM